MSAPSNTQVSWQESTPPRLGNMEQQIKSALKARGEDPAQWYWQREQSHKAAVKFENKMKDSDETIKRRIRAIASSKSISQDQAAERIIRIVEQAALGKKPPLALEAVQNFGRMDQDSATAALSRLFMKAGLGDDTGATSIRRAVIDQLSRVGGPEAKNQLAGNIALYHPEDAVRGLAALDAPELIADIAARQSDEGLLTAVQSTALNLLTSLHRMTTDDAARERIEQAAQKLTDSVFRNLPAAIRGGEQYRKNVLDFRPPQDMKPSQGNLTGLAAAFIAAENNGIVPEGTAEVFQNTAQTRPVFSLA